MSGKLCFPSIGRLRGEAIARGWGCEAELRGDAFPSGAWERGTRLAGIPMLESTLRWPTIHAAAAALRKKETTPIELVRHCLAEIDRREEGVKAWVFVD